MRDPCRNHVRVRGKYFSLAADGEETPLSWVRSAKAASFGPFPEARVPAYVGDVAPHHVPEHRLPRPDVPREPDPLEHRRGIRGEVPDEHTEFGRQQLLVPEQSVETDAEHLARERLAFVN